MSNKFDNQSLISELEQLKKDKQVLEKIISHDIRSPFNRVHALLQLIKLEELEVSEETQEYINAIYLAVLSGLEMIRNLNDNRHLDDQGISLNHTDSNVLKLVKRQLSEYSERAHIKKISLHLEPEDHDYSIHTDEHYLQRIISNLISNAIKYSKEGSEVNVFLSKKNDGVQIRVRDFGLGVLPSEEPLLFSKHAKLQANPTSGEGRTGLGLFLSKKYADALGYEISYVKPKNDFGSEFVLMIK